ncbi:YhgE/Pip domain-containing protein [Corynebacterium epidermidicanis]|uniref:YhgE/Pip-like protein n=1 Tax=Corynebacterium epidermidicanis TaxID=1050174 RepID=A0A0G3GQ26_9CORY|nr:YhgE/Pip domain-containing protein [Corynebacterium epidermidicanis]AKK03259.1 YhgE/Pip-like protein [Corynebacterium epidermidicanis]
MNLFHFGTEIRRFAHGKLPKAAFAVLVLLPLIFGGLFPWAYWDPIGGMKDMPVAIVNSDEGADILGQHINAGAEIQSELLKNDRVNFISATAEEASRGVADGTFYFALELPTDFSRSVASVQSDNPHPAKLNTIYNNTNGLIATALGNQVTNQVVSTVDAELGSQVTDKLLVGFNTIGAGMQQAAEGSGKLHDGVGTAREGADKLATGSGELAKGANELDQGAAKLATGAAELDQGIKKASAGATQLNTGMTKLGGATDQLGNGASQISAGVDQIVSLAQNAGTAQAQLTAPLVNISTQLKTLDVPAALDLAAQVDGLIAQANSQGVGPDSDIQAKLTQLKNGAATLAFQLSDPTAEYRAGLAQATDASAQLAQGLTQLSDGSGKLVVGTQTLNDGTTKLAGGASQLTVGANALRDGLVQLDEGSGELSLKLSDGAQKVPELSDTRRAETSQVIGKSVITSNTGQELTKFGVGLTPFFASLAMFMGGTIMFLVLRPFQRRAVDSGMFPVRAALASWFPAITIGCLQATAVWAVLTFLLGVNAAHSLGLWIALCGISISFVSLTQSINALLGPSAGRVVCLVLMALQLVSSGGLYPPETQPKFLQWFHTFDPITYSVNLIRQMIIGSNSALDHRLGQSITVLVAVFVAGLTISSLCAYRDRLIPQRKLHPELKI